MTLQVYDQPEGLVITDGNYQLYIDESEFSMRDDTTELDHVLFSSTPDYVKKRPMIEGKTYQFEEIVPQNGMVIITDEDQARVTYVYRSDTKEWLRTDSGVWVLNGDFEEEYHFKILYAGR